MDELRYYPADAQMTSYTHVPLIGMTSQTTANNLSTFYEYDGLNRLVNIRDENDNIRQNFTYNYGPGSPVTSGPVTLFYSAEKQQAFTKNDCTRGEPTIEAFKVPAGKYASAVSQQDADNKALAEITGEGQKYANSVGQCLFYNTTVSRRRFKDDCPPEQGIGSPVTYVVEARKWSSPIDQATADALAQKDLDDNTRTYVNAHGTCSCGGEGKKLVNGVCEQGQKWYLTSLLQPDNRYKCTYEYRFSDGTKSIVYTEYANQACPVL